MPLGLVSWGRWCLFELWVVTKCGPTTEYGMETSDIPCQREVHVSPKRRKNYILNVMGFDHYQEKGAGIINTLYGEMLYDKPKLVILSKYQGQLSVGVSWQCTSLYCCAHCWNTPATKLWNLRTSTIQLLYYFVRFSPVLTPEECLKRLFCQQPWGEIGAAWLKTLLSRSSLCENTFFLEA